MVRVSTTHKIRASLVMALAIMSGCDDRSSPSKTGTLPVPLTNELNPAPALAKNTAIAKPAAEFNVTDEAVGLTMGLWNDRVRRDSWDFLDDWASLAKWKPVPEHVLPLISANTGKTKAFLDQNDKRTLLVGVVLDSDSGSVTTEKDGDEENAYRLLSESMTLKLLGDREELGQKTDMYAAILGTERIGVVTISYGTISQSKGFLTVSIMHWKSAVALVPKTEAILTQMEIEAKNK